jgi:hypothetical protein
VEFIERISLDELMHPERAGDALSATGRFPADCGAKTFSWGCAIDSSGQGLI